MALALVTVTGKLTQPDKLTPLRGSATFVPNGGVLVDPGDNTILAGSVTVVLDYYGRFSVDLPATDSTGIQPTANSWNWGVTFNLTNATLAPFNFALLTGTGPVDLADVIQVAPLDGDYIVVPGPAGTNGAAGHTPQLYGGSAAPSTLHTDGDLYLRTNGDLYQQTAGAWGSPVGNIRGPAGADGTGGGSSTRTSDVRIEKENINLGAFPTWTVLTTTGDGTPLQCSIAAAVGDRIWADMVMMKTGSGNFLDLAMLNSAGAISEYAGTGTSSPLPEGDVFLYPGNSFPGVVGTIQFLVKAGQVNGSGNVTVALVVQGSGDGGEVVYASAAYPWRLRLTNIGPEPA